VTQIDNALAYSDGVAPTRLHVGSARDVHRDGLKHLLTWFPTGETT
jgi:hypothetical protein